MSDGLEFDEHQLETFEPPSDISPDLSKSSLRKGKWTVSETV